MERIKRLNSECLAVYIETDDHKTVYETAERAFETTFDLEQDKDDLDPEVYSKMIETDTIVSVRFYPFTPVCFYTVLHYDLDKALDEAIEILEQCEGGKDD